MSTLATRIRSGQAKNQRSSTDTGVAAPRRLLLLLPVGGRDPPRRRRPPSATAAGGREEGLRGALLRVAVPLLLAVHGEAPRGDLQGRNLCLFVAKKD